MSITNNYQRFLHLSTPPPPYPTTPDLTPRPDFIPANARKVSHDTKSQYGLYLHPTLDAPTIDHEPGSNHSLHKLLTLLCTYRSAPHSGVNVLLILIFSRGVSFQADYQRALAVVPGLKEPAKANGNPIYRPDAGRRRVPLSGVG